MNDSLVASADSNSGSDGQERPSVAVSYEFTSGLPALLERLELSVLLSTYQAGRVVSVGSHQQQLRIGFSHFDQAMGLCRTPTGIAVGTRDAIWTLPANREIASRIKPEGEHDIAFLARSCHHSGPLMGHDLAWGSDRLWLVNTLFNGLVTIKGDWSFVPQWQPPFIDGWAACDRCHLNGLALAEDGSAPAYVTALGETDIENGWREQKATGGCLIHVLSGEVVLRGLSMPHSPRLYQGQLYLLDSGRGALVRWIRSPVSRAPSRCYRALRAAWIVSPVMPLWGCHRLGSRRCSAACRFRKTSWTGAAVWRSWIWRH
jgi:uncharacterized protein (TIGR03032 family)